MTLKQKIAQLFVMGFRGNDVAPGSIIHKEITELGIGGVILFDKDMVYHRPVNNIKSPEQLQKLTTQLQGYSENKLFIGIDQEGGLINRLKPEYGFPESRSHKTLGKIDDVLETRKESEGIASVLKDMNINLNFAPVVDIAENMDESVIGLRERSFGGHPDLVGKHAEAYIDGHDKYNIITCCKHFPGLGSAVGDTHFGFVDVTDTWKDSDTEPYRYIMGKGKSRMIMTAHIFNSNLDDKYPATLSNKTIQGFLRDELGYDGVVISDDMQMQAISDHYSLKEALELGINAGLDLFCFGNNLLLEQVRAEDVVNTVMELVEEGKVTEARIDESVKRITALKNTI